MAEKTEAAEKSTKKTEAAEKVASKAAATAAPSPAPESKKFDFTSLNTLAVVSIATALTSIGAVAAIITGHIALAQIKKSGATGRGLAIAGLVVGYATVAFWVLSSLFWMGLALKGFGGYGMMGFDDYRQFGPGMMGNN
ncbi:MAG: hypothetical protein RIS82_461 [Actinomycetota bacterium]|jgi:apolipoprotein N-acyltransferase